VNLCRASLPRFEEVLGSVAAVMRDVYKDMGHREHKQKKQKCDAEKFEGLDERNGKKDEEVDAEKFKGPDEMNGKKDEKKQKFGNTDAMFHKQFKEEEQK
jgi:hypothetical protein